MRTVVIAVGASLITPLITLLPVERGQQLGRMWGLGQGMVGYDRWRCPKSSRGISAERASM